MLEVYQKNQPAIDFYRRRVFTLSIAHGRMKPNYPPDYELAGGSNAVSVSSGPLYFLAMPAPYYPHSHSPAASWGIFGQHVHCAVFTNTVSG